MKATSKLEIIRGSNTKPVATEALIEELLEQESDGTLFIGYPVIASADGTLFVDALLVSHIRGIVCFDLIEGTSLGNHTNRQDDMYRGLTSRLHRHRELFAGRQLRVRIETATYAPAGISTQSTKEYPLLRRGEAARYVDGLSWHDSDPIIARRVLSAIQNISTIRRPAGARRDKQNGPRASKLKSLEDSIATLDPKQNRAVIETVEGVQRIRGLAGTGKTIILALKAAYLHARNPDWRIAVTFHTRSLKGFYSRLINNFVLEQTGEEPDWSQVRIVNSWGAPGHPDRDGIYFEFCARNDVQYYDFDSAKHEFGYDDAFDGAVTLALESVKMPEQAYDAILVDEAQDLPPNFLRLCCASLKDPKRLVYAYDELQNLSNDGLPPSREIFGEDKIGDAVVNFAVQDHGGPERDIILNMCYRNSRPVLVSAHALGFGVCRLPTHSNEVGLIQMFDRPELWLDVGYRVVSGSLTLGSEVALGRPAETSPRFLEEHSEADDLIQFRAFDTESAQARWIAEQILINLNSDGLRPSDIMVINTDPLKAPAKLGPLRKLLARQNIASHVAGVDTSADEFRRDDSVTCTGIYRAKGNEAPMVYVMNAQQSFDASANLARFRNRLFTAMTRSTAWLRVTGVGSGMNALCTEFEQVRDAGFELRFRYPSEPELNRMKVVHRDMSESEQFERDKGLAAAHRLIDSLREGTVRREDIDNEDLELLRQLLDR